MLWVLALALSFFYNLILPLSVAGILALVVYPVAGRLKKCMRLFRVVATRIVLLIVMVMIGGTYSCWCRPGSVTGESGPYSQHDFRTWRGPHRDPEPCERRGGGRSGRQALGALSNRQSSGDHITSRS